MKALFKNVMKLGLILTAYTVVACVGLAFMDQITRPIIGGHEARRTERSLKSLFPDGDGFEAIEGFSAGADKVKFLAAYKITKGGEPVGVAVKAAGPSYGGDITVLVGVARDEKIAGAIILSHKDTPGLGANAMNPNYFVDKKTKTTFPGQFAGKPVSDPFEPKKDVIAITASTITSRAVSTVVKRAGEAGNAYLAGVVK